MDIVQELFKKIVMIIPILLVVAIFFWLAGKVLPGTYFKNLIANKDILPPPRSTNTFKPSIAESPERVDNWSNNNWATNPKDTSYHEPLLSYYSSQNLNPLYLRNVTVKKHDSIYSGMVIRGEVKRSFFALGTFPVFVENLQKSRAFTQARALEPWQTGDWIKFEVILGKISQKSQCNLVFKNANPSGDPRFDIYTSIPVYCI